MSTFIDRAGIFKARPTEWAVQPSANSQAVAVQVDFTITDQLDSATGAWASWADFEEHTARGYWYVIAKDGKVNQTAVDQLVKSLAWNGDLRLVTGAAPDVPVQITVTEETYNSRTRFRASWLNPGDFVPGGSGGAPSEAVEKLAVQFGSLLRAAAAVATGGRRAPAPKPKPPDAPERPISDDDIPF